MKTRILVIDHKRYCQYIPQFKRFGVWWNILIWSLTYTENRSRYTLETARNDVELFVYKHNYKKDIKKVNYTIIDEKNWG